MLNNAQWLELGIDWDSGLIEKGTLDIAYRVSFRVVRESSGGYSIFHKVCGGGGQFQFTTEERAKSYLETQLNAKLEWSRLIAKREALTSRYQPLHKKLNIVNAQIDAILFAR